MKNLRIVRIECSVSAKPFFINVKPKEEDIKQVDWHDRALIFKFANDDIFNKSELV